MKLKLQINENGQALIFISLAFVILGMFIGLVVDGGRGYLMRERLRKIVDAAALAGAKAMAAVPEGADPIGAATLAACESAMINGLSRTDCGTEKFSVLVDPMATTESGFPEPRVRVTGRDTARTFFMALGALVGCETCKQIDVVASGEAVPDTLADVVVVLDDSGTMNHGCITFTEAGCPIRGAKEGAKVLTDMLLPPGSGSSAKIAFVPFRGCYASSRNLPASLPDPTGRKGCILFDEIQDLTNDKNALKTKIDSRFGAGGFPGTNVCLGMHEGRKRLLDPTKGREIAKKIMIILTDGDQTYSDSADGPQPGIPNLGNPTPSPYPPGPYVVGTGDGGGDTSPSCRALPPNEPGHPTLRWGNGAVPYDKAIGELDNKAMAYASMLKNTDPSGAKVEIYVLRFSDPNIDDVSSISPTGECVPGLVGYNGTNRGGKDGVPNAANASDIQDRNVSRCLASNRVMNDPFSSTNTPNDHYFFAATAEAITNQFMVIAKQILNRRRLVG